VKKLYLCGVMSLFFRSLLVVLGLLWGAGAAGQGRGYEVVSVVLGHSEAIKLDTASRQIQIKGPEGQVVKVSVNGDGPTTIKDASGTVYQVGKDGKVTVLGQTAAGGAPSAAAQSTVQTNLGSVVFANTGNSKGFLDTKTEKNIVDKFASEYKEAVLSDASGGVIYAPWKAVEAGGSDEVKATITLKNNSLNADSVRFIGSDGLLFKHGVRSGSECPENGVVNSNAFKYVTSPDDFTGVFGSFATTLMVEHKQNFREWQVNSIWPKRGWRLNLTPTTPYRLFDYVTLYREVGIKDCSGTEVLAPRTAQQVTILEAYWISTLMGHTYSVQKFDRALRTVTMATLALGPGAGGTSVIGRLIGRFYLGVWVINVVDFGLSETGTKNLLRTNLNTDQLEILNTWDEFVKYSNYAGLTVAGSQITATVVLWSGKFVASGLKIFGNAVKENEFLVNLRKVYKDKADDIFNALKDNWGKLRGGYNIEEFRKSLDLWRYGKNQWTWDEYYQNLLKNFPADYEKMITDFITTSTLTQSEAYAIFSTTTIFHQKELNRLIREGLINSQKVQDVVRLLDKALMKMPTVPVSVKYYRGVNLSGDDLVEFIKKHKKGEQIVYDEYTFAANVLDNSFLEKSNIKITIISKSNSNGKTIHPITFGKAYLNTKDEAIFMRNSKFEIIENTPKGDNNFEILLIEK
jgi:hypothetical protein